MRNPSLFTKSDQQKEEEKPTPIDIDMVQSK